MNYATETCDGRVPHAPPPDEVGDHAPRTAWREIMMERERVAERYRALKRRLLGGEG